jgi:hypothetical protein
MIADIVLPATEVAMTIVIILQTKIQLFPELSHIREMFASNCITGDGEIRTR